jgi:hypothetical protein
MRIALFMCTVCALQVAPAFGGKIVVNHDEWTMSNGQPNAGAFAVNVANWFSPGGPGNFLVYTGNFGLNNSTFTTALAGAGHTVTVNTGVTFDLASLSAYDGIFMGGYLGGYDASVLTNYVNAGGGVYLMGGTAGVGNEANVWDGFLNNFGFDYGPSYNGIGGAYAITSGHVIFAGVGSLYYNNGNTVNLFGANPNASIVESLNGAGLIGVYDSGSAVPEPSTLGLTAASLLAVGWALRRKRV